MGEPVEFNALRGVDEFLKYPGVDTLINHSRSNVAQGKALLRDNGQTSTISSMTFGDDQFEYLIPTIYDGQQVSGDEAIRLALEQMSLGVRYPTAPAGQWKALDELSKQVSSYLGRDAAPKEVNALRPLNAN